MRPSLSTQRKAVGDIPDFASRLKKPLLCAWTSAHSAKQLVLCARTILILLNPPSGIR